MTEYYVEKGLSREDRVRMAEELIFSAMIRFGVAFRTPDPDEDEVVFLIPVEDTFPAASLEVH